MTQSPAPARVLVPLGIAVCLSLFGDLTLYAVLVTQLDTVGLSLGAVGVMLGVNRLVRIPGNPLAGVLFDRWGRRSMFISGMVLGVVSTASYGLVRGFWPFLAGRLGWGVAWTLINVGGMAMVLDISTKADRGRWMGVYNMWVQAGLALGPLMGGFLVDVVGFRLAMLICAGITAVGLAVALTMLPETMRSSNLGQVSTPTRELDLRRYLRRDRLGQVVALLRSKRSLIAASCLFLITMFAGDGIVLSTVSLLLQQRFAERVVLGSLALGVASAGGLLLGLRSMLAGAVGPLAGHLSDAHGRWPMITVSLILGMAGFGLLAYATSMWLVVLGVVLGAVSGGTALATLAALVGDLAPSGRQGAAMGAYATAGDVGSMAGPFLAFTLITVVDLKWVYLLCSVTFLAGLGLVWWGRRRRQR